MRKSILPSVPCPRLRRRFAAIPLFLAALLLPSVVRADTFAIGHRSEGFVDSARSNRPVPAEIYYPADAPGEDVPVGGAPGTRFPVITFGHGFLIPWDDYEYVWTGLVAEGYIVVLPRTEEGLLPDHLELGRDLAFLVDALEQEGQTPGSPFHERVAETAAVMGHSMGGGASFLAAQESPALTAIANLAAAETNPSAVSAAGEIEIPALLFAGSEDCVTPPADHQIPMYDSLASSCKTYIDITGGSHCQFAEANFTCNLGEIGCPAPGVTREQQHALVLQYLTPWLDFHLKADGAAWGAFQGLLAGGSGITWMQDCVITQVAEQDPDPGSVPAAMASLLANRPNPFNPGTTVAFELLLPAEVRLDVFDISGHRVRVLREGLLPPGRYEDFWDGRDRAGTPVSSGVYLLRLSAGDRPISRKMILTR